MSNNGYQPSCRAIPEAKDFLGHVPEVENSNNKEEEKAKDSR